MLFCNYSPTWFLGFDSILETLFILITLMIAGYAYRVYRFTGGKQFKRWAVGFLLISAAYLIQAITNFAIYQELVENTASPFIYQFLEVNRLYNIGLILHIVLFLSGYLLLMLVSLRIEDKRLIPLFAALILVTALGSIPFPPLFETVVGLILVYLIASTAQHHKGGRKTVSNGLVIAGFSVVLLGQLAYIFITVWNVSYALGHVLEFIGYCALATSMIVIMRKR